MLWSEGCWQRCRVRVGNARSVHAALRCCILIFTLVDLFFLFALLTFLLNFIPSVGSMIAVALPMPVVILDPDQEWWSMLLALAIPSVIQLTVGNLVEPAVMGKSMSISAVAVLAALSFFGTVWGIVGAFLSVPLAVILHMWLKRCVSCRVHCSAT